MPFYFPPDIDWDAYNTEIHSIWRSIRARYPDIILIPGDTEDFGVALAVVFPDHTPVSERGEIFDDIRGMHKQSPNKYVANGDIVYRYHDDEIPYSDIPINNEWVDNLLG
ncbi:MAG: hypothetical protein F4Z05_02070 [Chloroflexi bacterium]|nr:hypothetical protein [Chloroflexota bacterium]